MEPCINRPYVNSNPRFCTTCMNSFHRKHSNIQPRDVATVGQQCTEGVQSSPDTAWVVVKLGLPHSPGTWKYRASANLPVNGKSFSIWEVGTKACCLQVNSLPMESPNPCSKQAVYSTLREQSPTHQPQIKALCLQTCAPLKASKSM